MAKDLVPWKPWDPFKELQRMRTDMDRLWESFFEGKPARRPEDMSGWVPSIDLAETKDSYVVKTEIPGMEAKDLDIFLRADILTIRGEKKQELDWVLKGRRFFKWRTCVGRPFLPSGAGSGQQGNILFR